MYIRQVSQASLRQVRRWRSESKFEKGRMFNNELEQTLFGDCQDGISEVDFFYLGNSQKEV